MTMIGSVHMQQPQKTFRNSCLRDKSSQTRIGL